MRVHKCAYEHVCVCACVHRKVRAEIGAGEDTAAPQYLHPLGCPQCPWHPSGGAALPSDGVRSTEGPRGHDPIHTGRRGSGGGALGPELRESHLWLLGCGSPSSRARQLPPLHIVLQVLALGSVSPSCSQADPPAAPHPPGEERPGSPRPRLAARGWFALPRGAQGLQRPWIWAWIEVPIGRAA